MSEVLNLTNAGSGVIEPALWLDGNSDYVYAADHADWDFGSGDYCVEMWVRSDGISGNDTIIGQWNDTSRAWQISWDTSPIIYLARSTNGTSSITTNRTVTNETGQWYHIAVARSSTTLRLFVNGVQQGADISDSNTYFDSSAPLRIGVGKGGSENYWYGNIREVRISKGVARYTTDFLVPTEPFTSDANTVLLLHLDETPGSTSWTDSGNTVHSITGVGTSEQQGVYSWKNAAWLNDYSDSQHPVSPAADAKQAGSMFTPTAGYFDGNSDYLTVPDSADWDFGTGDFTIEAWVKPSVATGDLCIVGRNTNDMFLSFTGAGLWVGINGAQSSVFTADRTANQWSHVAWSRSGATNRVFQNGILLGTYSNSGSLTGSTVVEIGRRTNATWYFNGLMKDVRISNSARYTADFTPSQSQFTSDSNTKLLLHMNAPSGADSPIESSAYFDGSGDYLSIPDSDDWDLTGDFTIEFWLKFHVTISGTGHYVILGTGDAVERFDIGIGNTGGFYFHYDNVTEINNVNTDRSNDSKTWHHYAVVRSGTTIKGYQDGVEFASASSSEDLSGNASEFQIGRSPTDARYFKGWMKEVRISTNARWTADFTPPTAPYVSDANTILLLHFDGVPGDTDNTNGWLDDDGNTGHTVSTNGTPFCEYGSLHTNRTFVDDGDTGHDVTPTGTAFIDWVSVNDNGATQLDGTGDYLSVPDSDDWYFGSGNFTMQCWAKFNSVATAGFLGQKVDGSNYYSMFYEGGFLKWSANGGGSSIVFSESWTPVADIWYHLAIIRGWSGNANDFALTVNGAILGTATTDTDAMPNHSGIFVIGDNAQSSSEELNGFIDAVVVDKGTATWTANFIPPTYPSEGGGASGSFLGFFF